MPVLESEWSAKHIDDVSMQFLGEQCRGIQLLTKENAHTHTHNGIFCQDLREGAGHCGSVWEEEIYFLLDGQGNEGSI